MASLVLTGDTSGQVTIAAPAVAGTTTITMPATTGTMVVLPTTPSMVRLNTDAGFGSTNTAIRRFANTVTNTGSDITYADSATLGASFTTNTAGIYAVTFSIGTSSAANIGLSLNSTQLSTAIQSITISDQLVNAVTPSATWSACVSWTGYLPATSVVRPHTSVSITASTTNGLPTFTIVRVA